VTDRTRNPRTRRLDECVDGEAGEVAYPVEAHYHPDDVPAG